MKLDEFRLSDYQKESARVALGKYGYSEDDFEWVHAQDSSPGGDDQTLSAETVYVIYKPTGFRRMYGGASWQTEFEEDLKDRIFNPSS